MLRKTFLIFYSLVNFLVSDLFCFVFPAILAKQTRGTGEQGGKLLVKIALTKVMYLFPKLVFRLSETAQDLHPLAYPGRKIKRVFFPVLV